MTFEEWLQDLKNKNETTLEYTNIGLLKSAWSMGYDAGQSDGYEEGTRNGWGLDDGRTS